MRADKLAHVLSVLQRSRAYVLKEGAGDHDLYRDILAAETTVESGLAEVGVKIEAGRVPLIHTLRARQEEAAHV